VERNEPWDRSPQNNWDTLNEIKVVIADTADPFDRHLFEPGDPYVGAAVKLAATDARRQLLEAASHSESAARCSVCR
jgi:hypothetical protein